MLVQLDPGNNIQFLGLFSWVPSCVLSSHHSAAPRDFPSWSSELVSLFHCSLPVTVSLRVIQKIIQRKISYLHAFGVTVFLWSKSGFMYLTSHHFCSIPGGLLRAQELGKKTKNTEKFSCCLWLVGSLITLFWSDRESLAFLSHFFFLDCLVHSSKFGAAFEFSLGKQRKEEIREAHWHLIAFCYPFTSSIYLYYFLVYCSTHLCKVLTVVREEDRVACAFTVATGTRTQVVVLIENTRAPKSNFNFISSCFVSLWNPVVLSDRIKILISLYLIPSSLINSQFKKFRSNWRCGMETKVQILWVASAYA